MNTIQPVQSWVNGKAAEATILNVYAIQDDLTTSATFWYGLFDISMQNIANGNLIMSGSDYIAYETNQYAWDWIASSLNLTITGEYVPPAPVVESTPIVAEPIVEPIVETIVETPTAEIIAE